MEFWKDVEKIWGKQVTDAVHWSVNALLFAGIAVGIILVMFKIISGAMALNKEKDCGMGEALKESAKPMVKFIILILVAGISIPLLWNFLVPFLIKQGWGEDKAVALSMLVMGA